MQYYLAKAQGGTTQYETNERQALDEANQQAQRILADLEGAIKYVIDAKDQHPNREDLVVKNSTPFSWAERPGLSAASQSVQQGGGGSSAFGGGPQTLPFGSGVQQGSTFGQASGLGSSGGAFGKPSFGQASQPASQPGFGQTSAFGAAGPPFGKPSNLEGGGGGGSAFGQASRLGGGQQSAFGQASQLGSASAFGKPSALGGASPFAQAASNNTAGSAFGQPSQPGGGTPAFGQGSSFGAAAPSTSPFGRPSPFATSGSQAPTTGSAFGQASAPGQQQSSPFGQVSQPGQQQQSAFSQTSQPGQAPSAFEKPSPFGSGNTGSAFGQQSTPNSQPTAFGQGSTFGGSNNASPFGQQQQQPASDQQQTPFSSSGGNKPSTTFGQSTQIAHTGPPTAAHQKGQRISTWKGRQVTYEKDLPFYRNDQGKQERIWLPDGQDDVIGSVIDVEAPPGTYDDALGAALKQVYDFVRDKGMFKDGVVPEIPPKREWVRWDL